MLRKTLRICAFATTALSPLVAGAEEAVQSNVLRDITELKSLDETLERTPTSKVDVGVKFISADSFKHGEYTGLTQSGAYTDMNVWYLQRAPLGSKDAKFYEVEGTDLGLDSRRLRGRVGEQGKYSAFLEYDQIPHYISDSAKTIYGNAGDATLTLPRGYTRVGAANKAGMTPFLQDVELKTERKRVTGGFDKYLGDWQVKTQLRHEVKDGVKPLSLVMASSPSATNALATFVPEPIEYQTTRWDAMLSYNTKPVQAEMMYSFSRFANGLDSVTFDNPWDGPTAAVPAGVNAGAAGAPFKPLLGRAHLAPDNMAHTLKFNGGWNPSKKTRLTANLSYALQMQDEDLLPYTINSGATGVSTGNPTLPLPRKSADLMVHNIQANLQGTHKLTSALELKGRYRFDMRENPSDPTHFRMVTDDTTNYGLDPDRVTRPLSWQNHLAEGDASYRFSPETKLTVGYTFEQKQREYAEVTRSNEHTERARLNHSFGWANSWLSASHADRTSLNGYDPAAVLYEGHLYGMPANLLSQLDATTLGTLEREIAAGRLWWNHPDARKFMFADRNKDDIKGNVSFEPVDDMSVGFTGGFSNETYTDATYGRQHSQRYNLTGDVSYKSNDELKHSLFYTYEKSRMFQTSKYISGLTTAAHFDTNYWDLATSDMTHTLGIGTEWDLVPDTFKVGFNYMLTYGVTDMKLRANGTNATNGSLATGELPAITSINQSMTLFGDYQFDKALSFRLAYGYDRLRSRDFQIEDYSAANVLAGDTKAPDYDVHMVALSGRLKF